MTMPTTPQSDAIEALQRLAVKQGLTLGAMKRPDVLLLLAWAARSIPADQESSEAEVNAALRNWLACGGAMLRIDHVELRRSIVDAGYWRRDGYGRAYRRAPALPTDEAAAQAAAIAGIDADRIVAASRDQAVTERVMRKRTRLASAAAR